MQKMIRINTCAECPKVGKCEVLGNRKQQVAFFIGIGMPDLHPKCPLENAPQEIVEAKPEQPTTAVG